MIEIFRTNFVIFEQQVYECWFFGSWRCFGCWLSLFCQRCFVQFCLVQLQEGFKNIHKHNSRRTNVSQDSNIIISMFDWYVIGTSLIPQSVTSFFQLVKYSTQTHTHSERQFVVLWLCGFLLYIYVLLVRRQQRFCFRDGSRTVFANLSDA